MSLQQEIKSAKAKVREDLNYTDVLATEALFAVGLLLGAQFPYSAMLVLSLTEQVIGRDHPLLVEVREKLGVQND